jgi:hypothetical protein
MERLSDSEREPAVQTRTFRVRKVSAGRRVPELDLVVVEEPLEIRTAFWFKNSRVTDSLAVTMRTPGNEEELAAGNIGANDLKSRFPLTLRDWEPRLEPDTLCWANGRHGLCKLFHPGALELMIPNQPAPRARLADHGFFGVSVLVLQVLN